MTRVLFICHGNICRSVSAEYVMQTIVARAGRCDDFLIDSAATSTEEIGNPIYPPMEEVLRRRGIPIGQHRARQVRWEEYEDWDLIVAMDDENLYYLNRCLHGDPDHRVHTLMEYTDRPDHRIEDPWYPRMFDKCLDEIVEGCRALFRYLTEKAQMTSSSTEIKEHVDLFDRDWL